jgi:hypothetical protein
MSIEQTEAGRINSERASSLPAVLHLHRIEMAQAPASTAPRDMSANTNATALNVVAGMTRPAYAAASKARSEPRAQYRGSTQSRQTGRRTKKRPQR